MPMTREEIAAAMRGRSYTEEHYYDMIDESLNEPTDARQWPYYALDCVASPQEWQRFKAAMTRWMAEKDREHQEAYDQNALEQEHDDD